MDAGALQNFLLFALSAIASFATCQIIISLNKRTLIHVVATENKRRFNPQAIPLLGGLGICTAFMGAAAYLAFQNFFQSNDLHFFPILAAVATVMITGISDDIWEITPKKKLLGQFLACFFIMYAVKDLPTPARRVFGENEFATQFVTFTWIFGLLNSLNLLDGLDGLASGTALIAITCLQFISSNSGSLPLSLAITGATIGFYLCNRHPAKIYLGESGTQILGIGVFLSAMLYQTETSPSANFWGAFLPTSVLVVDTGLAIIRRFRRGVSLVKGDRDHIHHCFLRMGFSHEQTVKLIHGISIFYCLYSLKVVSTNSFTFLDAAILFCPLALSVLSFRFMQHKMLTHFSNTSRHILALIDRDGWREDKLLNRLKELKNTGVPHQLYRLDLDSCLSQLLERNPNRLQEFYSALMKSLNRGSYREAYLENSRTVLIVVKSTLSEAGSNHLSLIKTDLEQFEIVERVDMQLDAAHILRSTAHSEFESEKAAS